MRRLTWFIIKDPTEQLNRIERMLRDMSDMEAKLDIVIESVKATVAQVVDLVGQVMGKLEEAGSEVDLSDETSTLETLQSDLQSAVDRMQGSVAPADPVMAPDDTGLSDTAPSDAGTEEPA